MIGNIESIANRTTRKLHRNTFCPIFLIGCGSKKDIGLHCCGSREHSSLVFKHIRNIYIHITDNISLNPARLKSIVDTAETYLINCHGIIPCSGSDAPLRNYYGRLRQFIVARSETQGHQNKHRKYDLYIFHLYLYLL